MAIAKNNPLLHGLSGKLGPFVVRQTKKGTVVANAPVRHAKEPTAAQAKARKLFKEAIAYAKGTKGDELYKRLADQKQVNPFNLAVSDFRNPPVIEVDAADYFGKKEQPLRIHATSRGQIQGVKVSIENEAGKRLDGGKATTQDPKQEDWTWTATTSLPSQRVVIRVTAIDLPHHKTDLVIEREI